MSLKSGDYLLLAFDLQRRPIGPKSLRDIPTEVVVQPAGTQAHKWRVQNVEGDKYMLMFDNLVAMKKDGCVVMVPFLPGPRPFLWKIVPANRAPPSPEPLYGVFVPDESNEAWFARKEGDPFVEVPVTIFDEALTICFIPVHE